LPSYLPVHIAQQIVWTVLQNRWVKTPTPRSAHQAFQLVPSTCGGRGNAHATLVRAPAIFRRFAISLDFPHNQSPEDYCKSMIICKLLDRPKSQRKSKKN